MSKKKSIVVLVVVIGGLCLAPLTLYLADPLRFDNIVLTEEFVPGDWTWSFDVPSNSKIEVILSQGANMSDYEWDLVNKFTLTIGGETHVASLRIEQINLFSYIWNAIDTVVFNDTGEHTTLEIVYGSEDWWSIPEENHDPYLELTLSISLLEEWI